MVKQRFGGKRTLEYIVMPEQTGHFEISAVTFPYFNPQTQKYETASAGPVQIDVGAAVAGAGATGGSGGIAANPSAGQNVLGANLSRPIHTRAALAEAGLPLWTRPYFAPFLLAPFALLLGGAAVRRRPQPLRPGGSAQAHPLGPGPRAQALQGRRRAAREG